MAEQIKDTNVIKTPEVVINPMFFLPPDVIDMRPGYADDIDENDVSVDDVSDAYSPDDPSVSDGDIADDGGDGSSPLEAPENFSVVEQIVRIGSDGKAVVDVIVEFDDDGHGEYDLRITKSA